MDGLSVVEIRARLTASVVGRRLYLLGEVDSTNEVARRLAREGAADGTVVLADAQTAGRGRTGLSWFSPPGVNLHVSVLLRPPILAREADRFSLIAPLALADAIEDQGLGAAVRWPNEVLVGGKKVAAGRAECATRGVDVSHLVLGMGVNVNVESGALRDALGPAAGQATSLRAALGRELKRSAIAAAYLASLEAWMRRYREGGPEAVLAAWRSRDVIAGHRVQARRRDGTVEGHALGVDPTGHLVLEDVVGRNHAIGGEEILVVE